MSQNGGGGGGGAIRKEQKPFEKPKVEKKWNNWLSGFTAYVGVVTQTYPGSHQLQLNIWIIYS